jgi:hypothetical protein
MYWRNIMTLRRIRTFSGIALMGLSFTQASSHAKRLGTGNAPFLATTHDNAWRRVLPQETAPDSVRHGVIAAFRSPDSTFSGVPDVEILVR